MKPFTEILKWGDENDLVKDLQERLLSLGYQYTYLADGSVGELVAEGYFGDVTKSVLQDFQAKVIDFVVSTHLKEMVDNLGAGYIVKEDVDGIMDFCTHYVLNNYEKLSEFYGEEVKPDEVEIPVEPEISEKSNKEKLIEEDIRLAKTQVGVIEHGKNNYGKEVEMYQNVGSNGSFNGGQPYCQFFQNYLLITSCNNLELKYKMTYDGYTPTNVNNGKNKGIVIIKPKIDDIEIGSWGYVHNSERVCHVYLIIGKKGNNVITIEGNTNSGGSSDGQGVFHRQRAVGGNQCYAVVNWSKLYE